MDISETNPFYCPSFLEKKEVPSLRLIFLLLKWMESDSHNVRNVFSTGAGLVSTVEMDDDSDKIVMSFFCKMSAAKKASSVNTSRFVGYIFL